MASIFVYGTLRKGGALSPHWLVEHRAETRSGTVGGKLYEHPHGPYPVAQLGDDGVIVGEVIDIDEADKVGLDELYALLLMEQGAGYEPRMAVVDLDDGDQTKAWVCVWPPSKRTGRLIPSGDWIDHVDNAEPAPHCADCRFTLITAEEIADGVCGPCKRVAAQKCPGCGVQRTTAVCWNCGGIMFEPDPANTEHVVDDRIEAVLKFRVSPSYGYSLSAPGIGPLAGGQTWTSPARVAEFAKANGLRIIRRDTIRRNKDGEEYVAESKTSM